MVGINKAFQQGSKQGSDGLGGLWFPVLWFHGPSKTCRCVTRRGKMHILSETISIPLESLAQLLSLATEGDTHAQAALHAG